MSARARWREYVRQARAAVAAHDALVANSDREWAAHRAAHGCGRWSWCELDDSPEYARLNTAAVAALGALPAGTRSRAALDLFATADQLLTRRQARTAD